MGTYAELTKAADAAPEKPHSIDWAKWEKQIKTPGVVAEFKEAYSKLSIPAMEDTFTAGLESKFAAALESAEAAASASEARIEEELAANPEIAAEIEAEIKDNKW